MSVSEASSGHRLMSRVESEEGAYYKVRIDCSCGKVGAGKGFSKSRTTAGDQARATFDGHARVSALSPKERRTETTALAAMVGIPAAVVLAVVVLIGFGIANSLGGLDDDDGRDDAPSGLVDDSGTGIDCEKAVSQLMEREYGSWGSGSWPEGEYPERVKQCEGG